MNDDKYIGIEVLTDVLRNVTEMVDQRTTLLNSMFKEDLYNDFLMAEAMQGGMGGAGVDNVAPIGMGMPDLSIPQAPDSKQVVNVEDANLYIHEIRVDSASMLKRIRPAPQGRAHRIRKRSNHVTIVLNTKDNTQSK